MNINLIRRTVMTATALLLPVMFALPGWGATRGPDSLGYTGSDATVYSFANISGANGGTSVLAGVDDGAVALTLPFTFSFYGTNYTMVCVSSNGAVYFVANANTCSTIIDFANVDLSSVSPAPDLPALYPFWTDLTFQNPGGGSVFYQGFGTPGNRTFVIQWNNAYPQGDSSGITFQVVLTEGTNSITFQYQTVTLGAGDPNNNGALATVGIHNTGGLAAGQQLQWSYGSPVLSNGYALRFQTSAVPGSPILTAPANAATGLSTSVTLSWNAASAATSYDVYLGTTAAPLLFKSGVAATSYTVPTAAGTTYYWNIVAKNSAGASAPSTTWTFSTAAASSGGGGGGSGGGGNPVTLTVSPTSVTINAPFGGLPGTAIVTVSYVTLTQGAPTYTSNFNTNQGVGWIGVSPGTGTMVQASFVGLQYTYTATITISADPTGIPVGSVYTGTVNVSAAGGIASIPVTLNVVPVVAKTLPQPTGGIANAAGASQAPPSVVSIGSYIAIYGTSLAGLGTPGATSTPLPTTLNGTQLTLGGLPMPMNYAGPGQINAIVPQALKPNASYPLVVTNGSGSSVPVQMSVLELQPGIFTVNETGSGPGVVAEALTGQLNTASNPAQAGDFLVVYCTGLGIVLGPTGQAAPADGVAAPMSPIFATTSTVTAQIGGVAAPVSFSGLTPTFAGLYQVNVQVPAGVTPGNAVPLVITATDLQTGATGTSNSVTIVVQ